MTGPRKTLEVVISWTQDAVIIMECFAGCIESGILPSKCSKLRKLIDKTLAASGQRSTPVRRVPKRAAIGKAHDGMVLALQVIQTWASVHDGTALAPAAVIRLTEKALAEEKSARIDISPQTAIGQPTTPAQRSSGFWKFRPGRRPSSRLRRSL